MKHKHIIMSVVMAALVLVSLCAVSASALSVSAAQAAATPKFPLWSARLLALEHLRRAQPMGLGSTSL